MAPGSPLDPPQPSPAKKSSQELPFFPPDSPRTNHHLDSNDTVIEPEPISAAGITTSIIADEMDLDQGTTALPVRSTRSQLHTPEPQTTQPGQAPSQNQNNGHLYSRQGQDSQQQSPNTPGHIPFFDWDEFEARYEQALLEMNGQEKELLEEFDRLVNYFNVWASAAAAHDDERAVKRLQTRERYVRIAEQSLVQKKQHLTEVVRAFQSALALLSQT